MKKPTPQFRAVIQDGKLKVKDNYPYKKYIKMKFKEGDKVVISIKKHRKTRTSGQFWEKSNQNGYYWVVIIPILSQELGYEIDEMHDALKNKFLRIGGTDDLPKIRSTASLNTKEWEELMKEIRIWASLELNVIIPQPNEVILDD